MRTITAVLVLAGLLAWPSAPRSIAQKAPPPNPVKVLEYDITRVDPFLGNAREYSAWFVEMKVKNASPEPLKVSLVRIRFDDGASIGMGRYRGLNADGYPVSDDANVTLKPYETLKDTWYCDLVSNTPKKAPVKLRFETDRGIFYVPVKL